MEPHFEYRPRPYLRSVISPMLPLLVVAVPEEAAYLGSRYPLLITGIGKVNAATALASVLDGGPRPSQIVNVGTAGALRDDVTGVHEIGRIVQHDLDSETLHRLTGRWYGLPHTVAPDGTRLATGDLFVSDPEIRDQLAQVADLVDMEGYAVATVAARYGVPVRVVKAVSDNADGDAEQTWPEAVDACARQLADWVTTNL